jgi:branched-subunit amino acid aminotransferase/4-amino-4-deoxychorismate lyase
MTTLSVPGRAAYLNGRFIPAEDCKLAIYDMGVVLGASITDFARTFHGKLYRLEDHARRFYDSARYARIDPPHSLEETIELARALTHHNYGQEKNREIGLVFYMTGGENAIYAGASGMPQTIKSTFVLHTFPLPFQLWRNFFTEGVRCITPSTRHWPPQCLSSKIKNRNRLHMWIGDQEAKLADPNAMAIYLDLDGNITETGGSNFVIYRHGTVVSPRRNNILWGISLTVLTEILAEMKVPFLETDLQVYDAVNADEAWLPTTPYCLAPVVRFNGVPIGNGKPGPMWRRILDRWSQIVGKNIYDEITAVS